MCSEITNKNNQSENFYNVAIFIDYENVHKTLINRYENAIRLGFFEKLKVWCKANNRRIVKIAVYCNFDNKDLYESKHQSFLQSYGVDTIHTSNQGKNYADLKLAIDVLNEMYTNGNIDEFIIMSNDKDMTPLLNTVRLNKRKASVITTGECYNSVLCEFADQQIKFEDIIQISIEEPLVIEKLENRFFNDIKKHVEKGIKEYKESTDEKKYYRKHYNLDHFVITQSDYYNVFKYEILNMVSELYARNEIIVYENCYSKDKGLPSILPVEYMDEFIKLNIIKEENIYDTYDFIPCIQECYQQYWTKDKENA